MEEIIKGLQWIKENQRYGVSEACDDLIEKCKKLTSHNSDYADIRGGMMIKKIKALKENGVVYDTWDDGYKSGYNSAIDDVINILERSDNSDYAVPASPAPKLPSFNDVIYKMVEDGKEICMESFYATIKKLGNFA